MISSLHDAQAIVDRHFDAAADYWRDVYSEPGVAAQVYRERQAAVLRLVESLRLPLGTRVLEVGCGAGGTAVALAARGYTVEAVDSVEKMVSLTRQLSVQTGCEHLVNTRLADIQTLGYRNGEFALVLAIGVVPWLPSLERPLAELARVIRPGGFLIITADNKLRISRLLDPVARVSQVGGRILRLLRLRVNGPVVRMHTLWKFDSLLSEAGFHKCQSLTIGFGPLSFAKRPFLPDSTALRLHNWLQNFADRGVPVIRSLGSQYIVLARRSEFSVPERRT